MSIPNRLTNDFEFTGRVNFTGAVSLPDAIINADSLAPGANLPQNSLEHRQHVRYEQLDGSEVTNQSTAVFCAYRAGGLLDAQAVAHAVPTGGKNTTIDIQKCHAASWASVLAAPLVINSASSADTPIPFSLSGSPTFLAGDLLKLVVNTAGNTNTNVEGLLVDLVLYEEAA